jgi:hypothetical protein
MKTAIELVLVLLLMTLVACAPQTEAVAESATTQVDRQGELIARVTSLEHDLQRVKNDVLYLEFNNYIQNEVSLLNPPAQCEFVVSEWDQSQLTLKGFMDDSAGILKSSTDPRMRPAVNRLLFLINKTCRSNLLFNPQ